MLWASLTLGFSNGSKPIAFLSTPLPELAWAASLVDSYAAGETPEQIQSLVGNINWQEFLRSQQPFKELGFRRKEDSLTYPNLLEFGWHDGLALPSGLNSGQVLDSILDSVLLPYFDMKSFDDLPTPFRCVATDLVSGTEKDFDRGSLGSRPACHGLHSGAIHS